MRQVDPTLETMRRARLFKRPAHFPTTVAALLLLLPFFACGANPPRIVTAELRINYARGTANNNSQKMQMSAIVQDNDGMDDLEMLYILHDDSDLYWTVAQQQWAIVDFRGDQWIGVSDLAMPKSESFPEGMYRIQIYDAGGENDELLIQLRLPEQFDPIIPTLTIADPPSSALVLNSVYQNNLIVAFDGGNTRLGDYGANPGIIDTDALTDIFGSPIEQLILYVFSFPPDSDALIVTGGPFRNL